MVKIGNIYYFMFLILGVLISIVLFFLLKNKPKETQKKILKIILFCNLGLHFSKLLFDPYFSGLPSTIRKVTFENICAVSTLIFPFIYLRKKDNDLWKNYMFFIGIIGGGAALFYPTEAIDKNPFTFDVIRFYICHLVLFIVPLFSVIFKIIKLDYRLSWTIPLLFILIEFVILANEIILIKIGFVSSTKEMFFDRNIRNSSFIFGPTSAFDGICKYVEVFTFKIFKTDYFGINNGIDFYWPVIWLIIPAIIYMPLVYMIISLPFTYKNIINDWRKRR